MRKYFSQKTTPPRSNEISRQAKADEETITLGLNSKDEVDRKLRERDAERKRDRNFLQMLKGKYKKEAKKDRSEQSLKNQENGLSATGSSSGSSVDPNETKRAKMDKDVEYENPATRQIKVKIKKLGKDSNGNNTSVSYTHLTLPTIYSV